MTTDSTSSSPTPEQLAAANEQLQAQVNALRDDFNAQVGAVTPEEKAQAQQALSEGVGSIGDKWWLLLVLGVITTIVGLVAVFSPSTALTWLAVLFGIWLVVSGIFQLVRAFGSGLDGGDRTLFLIAGALSIILGVLCFRSALGVVGILVIIFGIAFIFRGIVLIVDSFRHAPVEGRGSGLLAGILLGIAGIVLLVWPDVTASVLVWIVGAVLILVGIIEIVGAFQVRKAAQGFDEVAATIAAS